MKHTPHLSIVSPVYQAANIIDQLVEGIQKEMLGLNVTYEIILVDDRSKDNSWEVMRNLSNKFKEVKAIRLSKNFGQHPSIMAGLTHAKGEWVVVMDCDLQDQPNELVHLYNKAKEGFDAVFAKRNNRKDNFLKKTFSKLYYLIFNYLAGTKIDNEIANFGIYNKEVIVAVLSIGDYIKSFPLFVYFSGFKTTSITVEHGERGSGDSSYSFSKLLNLAFDTIISYSNKPLKIFMRFGIFVSIVAMMSGIFMLLLYLNGKITVSGYSSLIISIWFLSGIIITAIGVVGIYVGKVFEQTKNRPPFIIDKIV
jgi:glycosyltransferase involved in cell wall biosynthesis